MAGAWLRKRPEIPRRSSPERIVDIAEWRTWYASDKWLVWETEGVPPCPFDPEFPAPHRPARQEE